MIRDAAPVTIQLAVAAVLIELLGIPLGVYSALRQYSFWDTALTTAALILWGIPVFVLGYFAMYIFGLKLDWLPIGGVGPTVLGIIPSTWESWQTLILPALTLGLIEVAYISYMQRASMLEVSRSDFIRTARAKGLSERKVIWGHGFKNAVIPVMTIAGIDLGALIGGAIITETVFNRPGIGMMIYQAINQRDTPSSPAACSSRRSSSCSPTCSSTSATRGWTRASAWRTECPTGTSEARGQGELRRPGSPRPTPWTRDLTEDGRSRRPSRQQAKPLGLWADTWRRLRRNHLALVGLGIIIVFISIGRSRPSSTRCTGTSAPPRPRPRAGYLAPYDPNMVNYDLSPSGSRLAAVLVAPVRHRLPRPRRALAHRWSRPASPCWSASSPSPSRSRWD